MKLEDLHYKRPRSPYSDVDLHWCRAEIGHITVDKNDDGTYDIWGPDDSVIDGMAGTQYRKLDPLTAQCVLLQLLSEVTDEIP